MTDRQARKLIYAVIETNKNRFNDDTLEALEMGRKALEQPTVDVLDKIRADIEREADYQDAYVNADVAKGMYMAIEIIDKYR